MGEGKDPDHKGILHNLVTPALVIAVILVIGVGARIIYAFLPKSVKKRCDEILAKVWPSKNSDLSDDGSSDSKRDTNTKVGPSKNSASSDYNSSDDSNNMNRELGDGDNPINGDEPSSQAGKLTGKTPHDKATTPPSSPIPDDNDSTPPPPDLSHMPKPPRKPISKPVSNTKVGPSKNSASSQAGTGATHAPTLPNNWPFHDFPHWERLLKNVIKQELSELKSGQAPARMLKQWKEEGYPFWRSLLHLGDARLPGYPCSKVVAALEDGTCDDADMLQAWKELGYPCATPKYRKGKR